MQEPMPNANKAYAMLLNVESHKSVYKIFEDTLEASAMLVKTQSSGKSTNNRAGFKKKDSEEKKTKKRIAYVNIAKGKVI